MSNGWGLTIVTTVGFKTSQWPVQSSVMYRHVKDKFGNSLPLRRAHLTSVREEHVDVGNKRLRFVADPEEEHDSVNRRFLERFYVKRESYNTLSDRVKAVEALVSRVTELEKTIKKCLQLTADETYWDANNRKITNVSRGDTSGDVTTFSQTVTFDCKTKQFRVGGKYYNLTETTPERPVLTAQVTADREIVYVAYGTDTEIPPSKALRWNRKTKLLHDRHHEIVWDEDVKLFTYRDETKWGKTYPHRSVKSFPVDFPLPLHNEGETPSAT